MPLRTFWAFNRNVDRLRAEADQRQLRLMSVTQDGKAAKEYSQRLASEIGHPVVVEKQFDAAKFKELAEQFSRGGKPAG